LRHGFSVFLAIPIKPRERDTSGSVFLRVFQRMSLPLVWRAAPEHVQIRWWIPWLCWRCHLEEQEIFLQQLCASRIHILLLICCESHQSSSKQKRHGACCQKNGTIGNHPVFYGQHHCRTSAKAALR
jgi:hypothetical protein